MRPVWGRLIPLMVVAGLFAAAAVALLPVPVGHVVGYGGAFLIGLLWPYQTWQA